LVTAQHDVFSKDVTVREARVVSWSEPGGREENSILHQLCNIMMTRDALLSSEVVANV
jgi:hypothetical protein